MMAIFGTRGRFFGPLAALAIAIAATTSAHAVPLEDASDADKQAAQKRFEEGAAHFEAERWNEAVEAFGASYEIVPTPNSQYMLGRSLRRAGKPIQAYHVLWNAADRARALVDEFPKYEKTAQMAEVELGILRMEIGLLKVSIENADPEKVQLRVGDRSVPAAEWDAVPLTPGENELVATSSDGREARASVVAEGGGDHQVVLRFPDAEPSTKKPATDEAKATVADDQPASLRPYAYVAGGVGALGLATFGVFGAMTKSTQSDLDDACGTQKVCPPGVQDKIDEGKTQQTIANIGLAVGIVGVGAAITLLVLEPETEEKIAGQGPKRRIQLLAGPSSIFIRGDL